jgi:hypothetical protein
MLVNKFCVSSLDAQYSCTLFLLQIVWENRNLGANNGCRARVTVDGTDFRIFEPIPFHVKWFSHKFNGPGLRYEIGISIQTGDIVWVHGPFRCGEWPDLRIAREALIYALDPGEMYLADGGYYDGNNWSDTPNGLNDYEQYQKSLARARHETANARFKMWGALRQIYRHKRESHWAVFNAIANITQLTIRNGEPLFQVQYNENEH